MTGCASCSPTLRACVWNARSITETTALGAGMLAAIGGGLVDSLAAAANLWQLERGFEPAMDAAVRDKLTERLG